MTESANNPFLMVRSTIEAEVAAPGIIAVSSALDVDGKTGVAAGLIRSLAAAGYTTLAIDAGASTPHAISVDSAAALLAESARPLAAGCDFVSIAPAQARSASATAIAAFYASIRARYDYAVIDAAVVTAGGLAFARNADGVVLALREGRAATDADRDAVALFERLNVRFLGVVATRDERKRGDAPQSLHDRLAPPAALRPAGSIDEPVRGVAFGAGPAPRRSAV